MSCTNEDIMRKLIELQEDQAKIGKNDEILELKKENDELKEQLHEMKILRSSDRFRTIDIYLMGAYAYSLKKSPRFKITECRNGLDCRNAGCIYLHKDDPIEKAALKKAMLFNQKSISVAIDRRTGKTQMLYFGKEGGKMFKKCEIEEE